MPIGFAVNQNQRLTEASAYLDSQTLALLNGMASALDSMMTADSLHDADRFAACYMRYILKLSRMKQALAMTDDLLDLSSTYENAVAYLLSLSDDIEGKTPDAFYEEFQ